MNAYPFPVALLLVFACLSTFAFAEPKPVATDSGISASVESSQRQKILDTIERLGHPEYAERSRAESELSQVGLYAFELLYQAQTHSSSEVAIAARRLLASLTIRWWTEKDDDQVIKILRPYSKLITAERETAIDRLNALPSRKGLSALCRIVRFESNQRLSAKAALVIMQQSSGLSDHPSHQDRRWAEEITETLGSQPLLRSTSKWLQAYAEDLTDGPYRIDIWQDLIAKERLHFSRNPQSPIDSKILLSLIRICSVRARNAGYHDEALRLAIETIDLIPPSKHQLISATTWALESKFFRQVLELQKHHRKLFDTVPRLLYAVADATKGLGDHERAEKLSATALAMEPLPEKGTTPAGISPDELESLARKHFVLAQYLASRGRHKWAIREYQHIIDALDFDHDVALLSRCKAGDLYAGLLLHSDAVRVLKPLVERVERDGDFLKKKSKRGLSPYFSSQRTTLRIQQALAASKAGDFSAARVVLKQVWSDTYENPDLVITMFHTPGPEKWKKDVREKIVELAASYDAAIRKEENNSERISLNPRHPAHGWRVSKDRLPSALNRRAWLIANTFGDFDKALQQSLRSLELAPMTPEFLDTCAHCYFAKGDLDNAVKYQKMAAERLPHSPPITRGLEMFIEAQKKAKIQLNTKKHKPE